VTPFDTFRLDGRVALVTGASAGLGERFARVLRAAGAEVVVTARRADALATLADEIGALPIAADLADADERREIVETVQEDCGRLDVLVNNAGTNDTGPLEDELLSEIQRVIDLNVVALMDVCRLCAPLLFASEHASVVNVASVYGIVSSSGPMAAYNASKGAVVNFTRHLAAQWGRHGVRVNALAPGYFPSEMTDDLRDPRLARAIEQRTVLGRAPEPSELDGPLLFLASDASTYVSGHTLLVDGGWSAL